jgi:hypothetical protein
MDNDLDRILSGDDDVVPSSAFVSDVMAAVRREASTPAPLPFPWRRVAPGLAICACALTTFLMVGIAQFRAGVETATPVPDALVDVIRYASSIDLGWIALALFASFVSTRLALARR